MMFTTIKVMPGTASGGTRLFEITQRGPDGLLVLDVIARNGREAIDRFRAAFGQIGSQDAVKVAA